MTNLFGNIGNKELLIILVVLILMQNDTLGFLDNPILIIAVIFLFFKDSFITTYSE